MVGSVSGAPLRSNTPMLHHRDQVVAGGDERHGFDPVRPPGRGMRSLPDDSVDRPCQSRPTHGRCGASMRWDTRCPRGARSSCRTCSPQVFCYVISSCGDVHCVNRSFIGRRQAESMSSPQYAVNILCFIGSGRQEVRGRRIERARGARGSRPAWCAAGKRGSTGNRLTRKPIRCWR